MPNRIDPPPDRNLPGWLLVLVPAGTWIAMLILEVMLLIYNDPPRPGLHSMFIAALVVLPILAHRMWTEQQRNRRTAMLTDRVCQHITREMTNVVRIMCKANDTPTEPILRVVGTAAVVTTPPPPPQRIDDEVISLAQRLQSKVTRELGH